jgi:hypothetical protein
VRALRDVLGLASRFPTLRKNGPASTSNMKLAAGHTG